MRPPLASVTPIAVATGKPGPADQGREMLPTGSRSRPDGKTALRRQHRLEHGDADLDGHQHGPAKPIKVGARPRAIAITPDGKTAYVLNQGGSAEAR